MVQSGLMNTIHDRSFENYESLHKALRHQWGDRVKEPYCEAPIPTGGAAATIPFALNYGETIALATGAGETWGILCDTDDNLYDGETVTIVWEDTDGVESTSVATFNAANTQTFSPFTVPAAITTGLTIISATCSKAVEAGDNVYVGTSGCRLTAAERRATIVATASVSTEAELVGIGSIEVKIQANTAADRAQIYNFKYVTIYGKLKYATVTTDAADCTTVKPPFEATYSRNGSTGVETYTATTRYVADFFDLRDDAFAKLLGAADLYLQRRTVLGAAAIYGVIGTANYSHVSANFAASSRSYLGDITVDYPDLIPGIATVTVTYTQFGKSIATTQSWVVTPYTAFSPRIFCERLAVGTRVTIAIVDDGAAGATANMKVRYLEVENP